MKCSLKRICKNWIACDFFCRIWFHHNRGKTSIHTIFKLGPPTLIYSPAFLFVDKNGGFCIMIGQIECQSDSPQRVKWICTKMGYGLIVWTRPKKNQIACSLCCSHCRKFRGLGHIFLQCERSLWVPLTTQIFFRSECLFLLALF